MIHSNKLFNLLGHSFFTILSYLKAEKAVFFPIKSAASNCSVKSTSSLCEKQNNY